MNQNNAERILSMFEDEGVLFLKSEDNIELSKGRKAEPLGMKKQWGGKDYIKTVTGWKPVGKESGAAKVAHDFVHGEKKEEDGGGGNYTIDTPKGSMSVTVMPNLKEGEFGVKVHNKVKNEDGTYKLQMKDVVYYPNDKFDSFMKDLKERGGRKLGDKKEEQVSEVK